ncbi:DUF3944 domain-containing protein [Campylobacter jejuni]
MAYRYDKDLEFLQRIKQSRTR